MRWVVGIAVLVLVALLAAALIPGSHSSPGTRPVGIRVTKVFGSKISAKRYGSEIGALENQGVDANGQLTSDLSPVSPRAFGGPISAYRVYAERWAGTLARSLPALRSALAGGRRGAAERAWGSAFADYLHLGAVYGLLPANLTAGLAGLPPTTGETNFGGLHRIEMGLWTGTRPRSLLPVLAALARSVVTLRRVLPGVSITPLDYTLRAHEILEDAQRDLMSGAQVPWSGAGVLGTEAGIVATREVISTLTPLLQGRDNTLVEVDNWLDELQAAFVAVRRRDGSWPALDQLSQLQRERLNGTLAGALGALEQVPGTLETAPVPDIPKLPASR